MTENPEAAASNLALTLVTASMDATFKTMDTLYEQERERRMALEVLIEDVLDRLEEAHMGSAREYERAVAPLRTSIFGPVMKQLAKRHRENDAT